MTVVTFEIPADQVCRCFFASKEEKAKAKEGSGIVRKYEYDEKLRRKAKASERLINSIKALFDMEGVRNYTVKTVIKNY